MPHDASQTPSDETLIARADAGDATAFEALYERYRQHVLRQARRYGLDDDGCNDALQEVFGYLLGKFPGFVLKTRMVSFLHPVIRHVAIRLRDKTRRLGSQSALEQAPEPAAPAGPNLDPDDLGVALAGLNPGQREVIFLRFVDDLPLEAIAERLEIPLGTVKSRIHKSLARLREDPRTRKFFSP